MNTTSPILRLAAALVFGATAITIALQPVHAEEVKKSAETRIDTRTTGSVRLNATTCDPDDPEAGLVCRLTRGEPGAKYPSAPVNPAFGF